MINMDIQNVSNMCKCITIIFHIVVACTYMLYLILLLPFNGMCVPIPTCVLLRVTVNI